MFILEITKNNKTESTTWSSVELAEAFAAKVGGEYSIKAGQVEDPAERSRRGDISSGLDYLRLTDWYAIRLVETGVPIPALVSTLRAAARIKASK